MNREKKAITVALYGLLIALAMVLSFVETMIPIPIPVPGIKLGLANLVTVVGLYLIGIPGTIAVTLIRIVLVGLSFGNPYSMIYGLSGSFLSLFVMAVLKETGKLSQVSISVLGGIAHNIGQITFAAVIVQTPGVFYYLPFLLAAGCIAGTLIGIVGGIITERLLSRIGVLFVISVCMLLPAVITVLCDWRINGTIVWSGFAVGGLLLLYILAVLPLWFKRPNPVIFVPIDFAAIGVFLLYVNYATGGHWFLTFALPVTGAAGLLVCAMVTLLRYLPGAALYICGGALILSGGMAVLVEFLLNLTFGLHETFLWSFYPLAAGVVLGAMLLVIAMCKPLRRSLHRKFFI